MLTQLSITNFLIIQQITIDVRPGLTVITGETGAGKSILLDALELLLGGKPRTACVHPLATHAVLSCQISLSAHTPARALLQEHGIAIEDDTLHIRRIIDSDNKSKVFLNDQSITTTLLRQVGPSLISIHGQFDDLFEPDHQRALLDQYAQLAPQLQILQEIYVQLQEFIQKETDYKTSQAHLQNQKEFLGFAQQELQTLNPQQNEESRILELRQQLTNSAKIQETLQHLEHTLLGEQGLYDHINDALKNVRKLETLLNQDTPCVGLLESVHTPLADVERQIVQWKAQFQNSEHSLESLDDRLHQLRDMGRKYRVHPDQLFEKMKEITEQLTTLTNADTLCAEWAQHIAELKVQYHQQSQILHHKRTDAAAILERKIQQELPALKLEQAEFQIQITALPDDHLSATGTDRITFMIKPNPGLPWGALSDVASGGELNRIMLALRVALGHVDEVPTLIFDEIDTGTGGAVASSIGKRLKELSQHQQIICITHSAQVASNGDIHLRLEKTHSQNMTHTQLYELNTPERVQEIARMLAGQTITEAAEHAAQELLRVG